MLDFSHLRFASGDTSGARPIRRPAKKPPTFAAPLRALIIEDELIVAWAIESSLENFGHEVVDICPSGESALSAGIGDATLIIVDINLGDGMDGIETAVELRRAAAVPIIFCSAYSDQRTRERAMAAVPDAGFVTKPFVDRDLEQAIQAATRVRH